MAEENVKNEEISKEVESEVSGKSIKIAIFILVSIFIIAIFIFVVYYLKHLIFKEAPEGFVVAFIVFSGIFGLSLILYLIGSIIKINFLEKSSPIIMKFSGLGVLFVILVFLVIYGPIKPYLQKMFSGIKKAMYEISIQMCYFSPEVVIQGNTEKCLPKDSRKIGYFKNLEILFDDEYFKNSPPRAGKKYRLNVFLNNLNEDGFSWSDIKVKKVEGFANTDDEYIESYAVHNKEIIVPANSKVPIYLDFSTMPTECKDRIKFKIVATADMLTVGSSKMLSLPKYSFQDQSEKIKNELKAFDKRVSSSPGPINVFAWPSNDVITSDEANDFVIQINIHNYEKGVAEITDVKLGIQRMYIEIKRCEDLYQEEIVMTECKIDDMTYCKRFSLKDVKLTPKESYTIYCYASINEGKYDESLKESLITAEVNYLYNFEAVKYFELKGCRRPVITTTVAECEYPRECRKYSCPEGYREVNRKCDIADAVCCEPLDLVERCEPPGMCRKDSCPEGYREVDKKCDMVDAICCEPINSYKFSWPVDSYIRITSCFGWRYIPATQTQNFHSGIDLSIPVDTEIKAAEDGEVIKLRNDDGSTPVDGYGNYIKLQHNFNGVTYYTLYAHIKCNGVKVNVGDKVKKGDVIALSGGADNCKGTSTGPHLHFEIREGSNTQSASINPCLVLENCECDTSCEKYSQRNDPNKCPKS